MIVLVLMVDVVVVLMMMITTTTATFILPVMIAVMVGWMFPSYNIDIHHPTVDMFASLYM